MKSSSTPSGSASRARLRPASFRSARTVGAAVPSGIDIVGIADKRLDPRHRKALRAKLDRWRRLRTSRKIACIRAVEFARPAEHVPCRVSASPAPIPRRHRRSIAAATSTLRAVRHPGDPRTSPSTSGWPSACAKSCAASPIRRSGGSSESASRIGRASSGSRRVCDGRVPHSVRRPPCRRAAGALRERPRCEPVGHRRDGGAPSRAPTRRQTIPGTRSAEFSDRTKRREQEAPGKARAPPQPRLEKSRVSPFESVAAAIVAWMWALTRSEECDGSLRCPRPLQVSQGGPSMREARSRADSHLVSDSPRAAMVGTAAHLPDALRQSRSQAHGRALRCRA